MDLFKIKLNIWSNGFNIGYMTNFINLKSIPSCYFENVEFILLIIL